MVGHGFNAVEPDTDAHHIELLFGEAHDAGGVENVAKNVVVECGLHHCRTFFEIGKLPHGVGILRRLICHAKVGEHRCRLNYILTFQQFDEGGQLFFGESEAMHTGVDFDVHGKIVGTIFGTLFDE